MSIPLSASFLSLASVGSTIAQRKKEGTLAREVSATTTQWTHAAPLQLERGEVRLTRAGNGRFGVWVRGHERCGSFSGVLGLIFGS